MIVLHWFYEDEIYFFFFSWKLRNLLTYKWNMVSRLAVILLVFYYLWVNSSWVLPISIQWNYIYIPRTFLLDLYTESEINYHREISPHHSSEPVTPKLQIWCSPYWANRSGFPFRRIASNYAVIKSSYLNSYTSDLICYCIHYFPYMC